MGFRKTEGLTFGTMEGDLLSQFLILFFVGVAVGVINTMAGGGSLITLPVLIFLGLPPAVANGTNRVAIAIQSVMGVSGFRSKGIKTFPYSIYLGISATIGAILGARIAVDIKGEVFNRILAIVMIVVVVLLVIKPKIREGAFIERTTGKYLWMGIAVFFLFGIYGGFINAGIGIPIMLFLHYVNQMNLVRVNATKVAVVAIYTLAALAVFALDGLVDWKLGAMLALGNGIGAWVSARVAVKRGDNFVKVFLIIMVVFMAIKLWFFS